MGHARAIQNHMTNKIDIQHRMGNERDIHNQIKRKRYTPTSEDT
jgi:hypothetical protein